MYITMKLKLNYEQIYDITAVYYKYIDLFSFFFFVTLLLGTECIYLNLIHWWAKTMIANNTNAFCQATFCLFVKSTLFSTFFKALSFIYFLQSKSNSASNPPLIVEPGPDCSLWIAAFIVDSVQTFCTERAPLRVPGWLLILYQILL